MTLEDEAEQPEIVEPALTTKWAHGATTVYKNMTSENDSTPTPVAPKKTIKTHAKEWLWTWVTVVIVTVVGAFITAIVHAVFPTN